MTPTYDGFETWFQSEWGRFVASLSVVDGDMDAARDAAAEAFARALVSWDRVQGMERRTGWLYRTGFNIQRRRLRRRAFERRWTPRQFEVGAPDTCVDLHRAVSDLPRRQRVAIVLTYFADLPQEEVAEAMGVRRGTVASTLADARSSLAITLKEAT